MSEPAPYNGLAGLTPGLPAMWYFDEAHYQRELEQVWLKHWLYVGRAEQLSAPGSFLRDGVAEQSVIVLRDGEGALRAFHNVCRHRGAQLCQAEFGTLAGGAIVCPYHGWRYELSGRLARTPQFGRATPAALADIALHPVPVREWRGFVFIHLGRPTDGPEDGLLAGAQGLAHWPLEALRIGHTQERLVQCNWKVFWENYNECLHCPGVHPALSAMVPIYRRGIMEERDDPRWREHRAAAGDRIDPAERGGLRAGARSWSEDGQTCGAEFPDLTAEERRVGYHYQTHLPSTYLAAHVDYVRAVRLRPAGPCATAVRTQWLFPAATLARGADLGPTITFGERVMREDAEICETTQRGQRARPYEHALLMPEEYDVAGFQQWVRSALTA